MRARIWRKKGYCQVAFGQLQREVPVRRISRRARLAGDVLHDGHGALAHERDGHRMVADAPARDAAGGVGDAQEDFAMIFSARALPLNKRGGRLAQLFGFRAAGLAAQG